MCRAGLSATNQVLPAAAGTFLTVCLGVGLAAAPAAAQISRAEEEEACRARVRSYELLAGAVFG